MTPSSTSPRTHAALSFSLLGFPVRARVEFFLMFALFGLGGGRGVQQVAGWVAVGFVSVLFHELGHALVGKAFGCRSVIELHTMGGTTYLTSSRGDAAPVSWFGDLLISLAGPAFGLALGTTVWLLARQFPALALGETGRWLIPQLLWANIGWSLINLFPILPYDGGLAARSVLRRVFPRTGDRISHTVTLLLGGAIIAAAIAFRNRWSGAVWIGYLAARGVATSWVALRDERLDRAMADVWASWNACDFSAALAKATLLREKTDGARQGASTELIVLSCLAMKDAVGAKNAFALYPEGPLPSTLLRAILALDRQDGTAGELLAQVPSTVATKVLFPLLVVWGRAALPAESAWQDRVFAWLDATTVRALPQELTRSLASLFFDEQRYLLARHVLEQRFAVTKEAVDAYNVACCCARIGEGSVGVDWLGRAIDAGWSDAEAVDVDSDLAPLRVVPAYPSIRARLGQLPLAEAGGPY